MARRRRDVQRPRRLPQDARRHDVPVVHGDARGGALDARPRQRAAAGDGRAARRSGPRRRGRARGARSVPRVPGVQGRVSGRRRRRALQERVPRRLLAAPRHAAARARARPRPRPVALGQPRSRRSRTASRAARRPLAERAAARPRSPPRAAGVDVATRSRAGSRGDAGDRPTAAPVLLFNDTFTNYYNPRSAMAGVDVLERAGCARRRWRRTAAAAVR